MQSDNLLSHKKTHTPSEIDILYYRLLRDGVARFIDEVSKKYAIPGSDLLDIAPQNHEGAQPYFRRFGVIIETFDISNEANPTYVADLCTKNRTSLPKKKFDYIVCTEVLEHTLQPFLAAENLFYMLKPGGLVFVTTPFNFRIHGPLPDCWRFTIHGLLALFSKFEINSITATESPDRTLMPIQYQLIARKPLTTDCDQEHKGRSHEPG